MGIIQKYKSLSPKIKEVINVAIVLSVLIGILLYLQLSGQLSDIVPIILSADKRWLFLALVFEIGFLACEIASLVVACKMMKVNLRVKDLISISLLGQLFGNLTPMASGSQPAQAWAFTRKG